MKRSGITIKQASDERISLVSLADLLQERAERTPDRYAFIFLRNGEDDEERITYRQLYDSALTISGELSESTRPGDRALMFYPAGLEFVKALFGCFYAGVIAVPAYPPRKNRSLERLQALVSDSGAGLVLSTDDIRQTCERSFSDTIELQKLNWISTYLNPDSQIQSPNPPILKSPNPQISKSPNLQIPKSPNPQIALLQYTSGSTGRPKGIMVTHRNLMCNLEFLKQAFELSEDTVSVHWLPVFHDMGLVFGVLEAIYSGYTGILLPPVSFIQKPSRWLRAISKYKATLAGAPNFAYDHCVSDIADEECADLDLSSLKSLYNGAEPVRKLTLESFVRKFKPFGFRAEMFYPTYGMAEATLILSGGHIHTEPMVIWVDKRDLEKNSITVVGENDENCCSLLSVGWPRIDTKIINTDPKTFEPCREDEVGEIWVSGSIVTKGYWNKEEATSETFKAFIKGNGEGPYLRTGDLGFFHEGNLFISGRLKDVIIIRGRNYYPQDIEFLAESSHNALRKNASAAFSVNIDGMERLVLVAEVERTAIRGLCVDEVCNAIRTKIAEEMELAVYAIQLLRTASILKTSSGKIRRKACREAYLNKSSDILGESVLDNTYMEEQNKAEVPDLVTIQAWLMTWIHIQLRIRLEKIDLKKPLSVYDLNSMKTVQLQHDFLTKYGVNFPPYLFFERISLKELAERALKLIRESE